MVCKACSNNEAVLDDLCKTCYNQNVIYTNAMNGSTEAYSEFFRKAIQNAFNENKSDDMFAFNIDTNVFERPIEGRRYDQNINVRIWHSATISFSKPAKVCSISDISLC